MGESSEPRRRSVRVRGFDYVGRGGYFITVCTRGRACLFGEVVGGEMRVNAMGEVVRHEWIRAADVRPRVFLDPNEFVVMPNHVHGIIWIVDSERTDAQRANRRVAPTSHRRTSGLRPGSVGAIVGQFKSLATKSINAHLGTRGSPVWQRNYFEHIIRSGEAVDRIRRYILENPARWEFDGENPHLREKGHGEEQPDRSIHGRGDPEGRPAGQFQDDSRSAT